MSCNRVVLTDHLTTRVYCGTQTTFGWDDIQTEGHGRTGQVKKASRFRRSIEVSGENLNRGSLIKFLNAVITKTDLTALEEGYLGVFGGSTDEDIIATFNKIRALPDLKKILNQLKSREETYLIGDQRSALITR